ncbi:MAG TPA: ATP-binding domain-containing protein, partial [Planctomycetota bacterium]|nr:ATP-binding domain-containing protein [Planctomycetota bacterium]
DRERDPVPGSEGIEILTSLLALSFEVRPLLGQRIGRHEQELARLTIDQYRVLDGLGRLRRALICGCAGSGKTMLALEKVKRLSAQGYRTLYVCYNRQLRESCARHLEGFPNALVDTFHGLCQKWARKAGVPVQEDESRDYWDRRLPEALLAAAKRIDDRFDAIIVDEGQDFKAPWWRPLQAAFRDGRRGILYVFYDDNQTLYTDELKFPAVDGQYDLSENCRNLRRIHDLVVRFFRAERKTFSRASPGEKPEIMVYRSEAELLDLVGKTVARLAGDQKIAARNIAVLTGHGKERSAVWRARRFAGFTLTDKAEPGEGEIFWSSVHAFKGLERAVVVLAEIEPLSHAELGTLLYVGCSRARVHLAVILSEAASRLARLEESR